MSFAALSTVIAVFENLIANLMDTLGMQRENATLVNMVLIGILSMPVSGF